MNGYNFSNASDIRLGGSTITALYYGSTLIWPKTSPTIDWSTEYLQVEALEPLILRNNRMVIEYPTVPLVIQYSIDKVNWYSWNQDISLSLIKGDIVYFRGSYSNIFAQDTTTVDNVIFFSDNSYIVRGNIMSLIYGDNFIGQTSLAGYNQCFRDLFKTLSLIDASNIIFPATTLSTACYREMFYNCTALENAPALPATTLAESCYEGMFNGCTSLNTAPTSLPATTLYESCYEKMFLNCSSLTIAPQLSATALAKRCCFCMFEFCTSLTRAPQLYANTLIERCYEGMFEGCTSLNYIKCLATNISASYCINGWVNNVASSGTFVKDANITWPSGSSGIPLGWTVQNV